MKLEDCKATPKLEEVKKDCIYRFKERILVTESNEYYVKGVELETKEPVCMARDLFVELYCEV